ncbi:MAG: iron ABC transporter permease [Chitinophagaceae bacterium]
MKKKMIYGLLAAGLLVAIAFSLGLGAMHIPVKEVLRVLGSKIGLVSSATVDEQYEAVLIVVRLPRVLLGVLVGAALGISGAAVQAIFRNPLAEPGLIGISAGASLVSAVIIALEMGLLASISEWLGQYLLVFGAFAGAGIAAMLVYQLSKADGKPNVATMLLAGIAINALAGAITGLITYTSSEQQLRTITFWMLGSLAGAGWSNVICVAPCIIVPLIWLPLMGKKLNAFSLGESQADQLGVRTSSVKKTIVLLSTLAVGSAVSVTGIIGFVGLLVPHTVRLIGGVDNRYVLPASALLGALVLTVADMIARVVTAPMELPIGVVTALLGTPVFLYILIKDKKKLLH